MTQPNILLLYADQHRGDVLGCAGNEIVQTPNLDNLARDGVRFTRAWTESPVCQPARAALATGRYPHQIGITTNFGKELSSAEPTMMRHLHDVGYTTAVVGKTHYSNWPAGRNADHSVPPSEDWLRGYGYDHVVEEFDRYVHVGRAVTPYMAFLREHGMLETYQDAIKSIFRLTPRMWEGITSPLPQELDLTSFLASRAIDWLEGLDGSQPFFLHLSFVQPHPPMMGDPVWAAHYDGAPINRVAPAHAEPSTEAWARFIRFCRKHANADLLTDELVRGAARQYYAMVSLIDQRAGDVLAVLARRGWLDNTLVVYTADHGEMLGDHGLMAKFNFYKPSVGIPAIVRPPQSRARTGELSGEVSEELVQPVDLVATMLDAAGAAPLPRCGGRSVLDDSSARELAYSAIRLGGDSPLFAAVTDGHTRFTMTLDRTACELFDLDNDPAETTNLVDDPSRRALVDDYTAALSDFLAPAGTAA